MRWSEEEWGTLLSKPFRTYNLSLHLSKPFYLSFSPLPWIYWRLGATRYAKVRYSSTSSVSETSMNKYRKLRNHREQQRSSKIFRAAWCEKLCKSTPAETSYHTSMAHTQLYESTVWNYFSYTNICSCMGSHEAYGGEYGQQYTRWEGNDSKQCGRVAITFLQPPAELLIALYLCDTVCLR